MNTKRDYVKEYFDYSFGKDRRITKLVNDIKKLEEIQTDNQVMKVSWKSVVSEKKDTWVEESAYDKSFGINYDLEKNGQGWYQDLELIDRNGVGHGFDNEMANWYYKDLKVELLDLPNHEEYVEECELCVVWIGGIWHGTEEPCSEHWN